MMDYQEVIDTLQDIHDVAEIRIKNGDTRGVVYISPDKLDGLKTAISAMQEIQMCKDSRLCLIPESVYSKHCAELDAYKLLGTLEEVRDAVEKQKKKKPIEDSNHGIRHTEVYRCPSCNGIFSGRGFAKYCFHCGQAIDWSEKEFQAPYRPNKCHVYFGAANNDCERCAK